MSINKMSGVEVLQAMISGDIPAASISHTMGMKATSVEKGKVIFEVIADDRHLNPLGGVHGGFAATTLDSVTGCAVHSMLEAGVGYGTVDLNVKMVRPIPMNTKLISEGRVLNISRSLGISEGSIQDESGKIYAHATASCMIIRR